MARQFDIPLFYKSSIISRVKRARQDRDPRKRDLSPTRLDLGPIHVHLARHFGFCFGVFTDHGTVGQFTVFINDCLGDSTISSNTVIG